jgi:hypothetical protein
LISLQSPREKVLPRTELAGGRATIGDVVCKVEPEIAREDGTMNLNTSLDGESPSKIRQEHEPPTAVAEWGWRYHHMGIPTETPRPGEIHLKELGMHVSGFGTSPYGVEWMRFDSGSPVSELVRTVPHIAFEVDDLDRALEGKELIGEVSSPMAGVRVAMILHNGMPVELLEFSLT